MGGRWGRGVDEAGEDVFSSGVDDFGAGGGRSRREREGWAGKVAGAASGRCGWCKTRGAARRDVHGRGGKFWGDAAGRESAGAADRRAQGFGAERGLARRLPEWAGGGEDAAADQRAVRGAAPGDGAPGRSGQRGGGAVGEAPVRFVGVVRVAGPGGGGGPEGPDRGRAAGRVARGGGGFCAGERWREGTAERVADLEQPIEQGTVSLTRDLPFGAVLETCGGERHATTFGAQAAQAGSMPDEPALGCVPRGGEDRPGNLPDRGAERGGGVHDRRVHDAAGHGHERGRRVPADARPAASRSGGPRADGCGSPGRERAVCARGGGGGGAERRRPIASRPFQPGLIALCTSRSGKPAGSRTGCRRGRGRQRKTRSRASQAAATPVSLRRRAPRAAAIAAGCGVARRAASAEVAAASP